MIKLYYSNGSCSLASHITLEELGLPYEAVRVDFHKGPSPEFYEMNPMGAVPVLQLENGEALTEGAVILQYLSDLRPEISLAPRGGSMERVRLQEWLNFIATEIHKGFSPLYALEAISSDPSVQEKIRAFFINALGNKFDILSKKMGDRPFLMPSGFSVADAYLFTVLRWTGYLKIDLGHWPNLKTYLERVQARPAVQRTLKAEHLI